MCASPSSTKQRWLLDPASWRLLRSRGSLKGIFFAFSEIWPNWLTLSSLHITLQIINYILENCIIIHIRTIRSSCDTCCRYNACEISVCRWWCWLVRVSHGEEIEINTRRKRWPFKNQEHLPQIALLPPYYHFSAAVATAIVWATYVIQKLSGIQSASKILIQRIGPKLDGMIQSECSMTGAQAVHWHHFAGRPCFCETVLWGTLYTIFTFGMSWT